MQGLERLLADLGWHIDSIEPISGGYAASLYRVKAMDRQGERVAAVYKRFLPDREQELTLYQQIAPELPYGLPKLFGTVQEEGERGILVEDSGSILKPVFQQRSRVEQESTLSALVRMLAELHVTFAEKGNAWLQAGVVSPYSFDSSETWAREALERLEFLAETEVGNVRMDTVQELQAMVDAFYPQYPGYMSGRQTFTHGDPHMENILVDQGQLRLIDWEYASLALPQRDVTILLQDVLDEELHTHALVNYQRALRERGWELEEESFFRGFIACMFDNTLMMLGWEIYKYQTGTLQRSEIEEIVAAKLPWIRRCFAQIMKKEC